MAESFFATLEREVLNRRWFRSQAEAAGGLVQSAPSPLGPRLSFTHQLREETVAAAECLKPKSVPVHETGASPISISAADLSGNSAIEPWSWHRHFQQNQRVVPAISAVATS